MTSHTGTLDGHRAFISTHVYILVDFFIFFILF